MTEVITQRDIEKSAGMFYCHKMFCDDRENETALEMLMHYLTVLGGGEDMSEYEAMILQVADHHAKTMVQAIEEVGSTHGDFGVQGKLREFAIKQACVMSALAEISTVLSGGQWDIPRDKTLADINASNIDEELSKITDGLSPNMLGTVAKVIVQNSYPTEKPTHEILVALWIEGAMVAIMADDIVRFLKEIEPEMWNRYVEAAHQKFIVIPTE